MSIEILVLPINNGAYSKIGPELNKNEILSFRSKGLNKITT